MFQKLVSERASFRPSPREPESRKFKQPGCPKFTNEVQHLLYKVLPWEKSINSFHWRIGVQLPGIAKPGRQSIADFDVTVIYISCNLLEKCVALDPDE